MSELPPDPLSGHRAFVLDRIKTLRERARQVQHPKAEEALNVIESDITKAQDAKRIQDLSDAVDDWESWVETYQKGE